MSEPVEDEDIPIRLREVILMAVFGIIPITAIYVIATIGVADEQGRMFEADRSAVMQSCIDAGLERMDCRQVVDEKILECQGASVGDPVAQRECIMGEHADWPAASREAKRLAKEAAEKRDRGRFAKEKAPEPEPEEAQESASESTQ